MKKSVNINGEKKQVEFESYLLSKEVVKERDERGSFEYRGQEVFRIDGTEYTVDWVSRRNSKRNSKASKTYTYKGIPFPDSQKKIIEFILNS